MITGGHARENAVTLCNQFSENQGGDRSSEKTSDVRPVCHTTELRPSGKHTPTTHQLKRDPQSDDEDSRHRHDHKEENRLHPITGK